MSNQKEEADLILETFKKEFGMIVVPGDRIEDGPRVDGKQAIAWMQEHKYSYWSEVEWPGFYVKFLAQDFCTSIPEFRFKPISRAKVHRIKGDFLWDFRTHDINSDPSVILNDAFDLENDIVNNKGIGIVLLVIIPDMDVGHEFRDWVEAQKGGPSEYSIRVRDEEGRPPRVRKKGFFVLEGRVFFLKPGDLDRGVKEGWMSRNFQKNMRNADQGRRNAKYVLFIDEVPDDILIARKKFNIAPGEDSGDDL